MPTPTAPILSRRKLWFFRGVLVCLVWGGGCVALEVALRWQGRRLQRSDVMEPGMMRFDAELGWALTPGWSGEHRHHEFTARYTIDGAGFRSNGVSGAGDHERAARRAGAAGGGAVGEGAIFVVGDSFTFGLGVGDADTFVAQLERNDPERRRWINAGVPGYSTDQELLLIEQRLLPRRPKAVLLVLYLANDVFDNGRDVPLQASWCKPRFRLVEGALQLQKLEEAGSERIRQTPSRAGNSLKVAVLGQDRKAWPWWLRTFSTSALWQTLVERLPCDIAEVVWEERFKQDLALTEILIERARQSCQREGVWFGLVLLAGRSHAQWPKSLSGAYQEYLRLRISQAAVSREWRIMDATLQMRLSEPSVVSKMYYPYDGHLTVEGHHRVARWINAAEVQH